MNGVTLIVADDRRSILDHRTIEKLVHLQYLSLSTNQVGQIPDAIAELKQLKNLDLRNNKISTVPPSLSQMSKLKKLWLDTNLLSNVPLEIIRRGWGRRALFQAYKSS